MITENLQEFMKKLEIKKDLCYYKNEEEGLFYPIPTSYLLPRIDKLELSADQVADAISHHKIDALDYKKTTITKKLPKYERTKNKRDMGVLEDREVEVVYIWNVSNQAGIHTSFQDKEEAIKLWNEINDSVSKVLNQ